MKTTRLTLNANNKCKGVKHTKLNTKAKKIYIEQLTTCTSCSSLLEQSPCKFAP